MLGQGYNLLTDSPSTGTCVDFHAVQDPSQQTSYSFDEVTSKTETMSKLDISASGSLKMAILKATASLNFLTQEEFDVDTKKFLLTATVVNSALFAAPSYDYKLGAKNLVPYVGTNFGTADPKNTEETTFQAEEPVTSITWNDANFKSDIEKCGHGFIAAIISGASVQAFMTMSTEDADSLTDIKGSLKADIGGIFSVSGSLASKQEHNSLVTSSNVSVFKSGGSGGPLAVDYEKLKASLLNLPKEAASTPRPLKIGILPYSALSKLNTTDDVTALFFQKGVSAYFLALDVFERTSSIIEDNFSATGLAQPDRRQPFALQPFEKYLATNTAALRLASDLSSLLVLCRDQAITDGKKPQDDPARSAWQGAIVAMQRVDPSQTVKRFSDDPEAQLSLEIAFDSAISDLQTPDVDRSLVVKTCSPDSSVFNDGVQRAIELTADEIAQRPVFFADMDATAQNEVVSAWTDFNNSRASNPTPEQLTQAQELFFTRLTKVLNQHKTINVSSALFRALCSNNIDNPLCQYGQSEFISETEAISNYSGINFVALETIGNP